MVGPSWNSRTWRSLATSSRQGGQRELGGDDVITLALQAFDYCAPTGAVGPGTVHEHYVQSLFHFIFPFCSAQDLDVLWD